MWVYDKEECWVLCMGGDEKTPPPFDVPLSAKVAVEVRGANMAAVGNALEMASSTRLLIPAEAAVDTVLIDIDDTTLGELIEDLGLVIADRESSA